jgi:hypothetical protein
MFRTRQSRILDLEKRHGTITDRHFLVIIDGNREEAEVESFGHVLTEKERESLERTEIEIAITGNVDRAVLKRLEEIATRNASDPPWHQDYLTTGGAEIATPALPEASETRRQPVDSDLLPEVRHEALLSFLKDF